MALRIPPGRAGRLWLTARIETARRASELLEQKRHVLLGAERAAAERATAAADVWAARADEAARWLERAAVQDGERPLRIARAHVGAAADVRLAWRTAMGVSVPDTASIELPPAVDPSVVPGGSAVVLALAAHRDALEAALEAAASRAAHDRLATELSATVRRLRAIESRWLPQHVQALAELEQALDENDRVEGVRVRWASRHR